MYIYIERERDGDLPWCVLRLVSIKLGNHVMQRLDFLLVDMQHQLGEGARQCSAGPLLLSIVYWHHTPLKLKIDAEAIQHVHMT